jgi:hypothetical protein
MHKKGCVSFQVLLLEFVNYNYSKGTYYCNSRSYPTPISLLSQTVVHLCESTWVLVCEIGSLGISLNLHVLILPIESVKVADYALHFGFELLH